MSSNPDDEPEKGAVESDGSGDIALESKEKEVVSVSLNALDLANNETTNTLSESNLAENKACSIIRSACDLNAELESVTTSASRENLMEHQNSYESEINRLKELLAQKDSEIKSLEDKIGEQEQNSKQEIEKLHQSFTQRLEQTLKNFQEMQNSKTSSMVMKYAEAEKRCIDLNRSIEFLQSKLNDSAKEKQRLSERLEKSKLDMDKLSEDNDKKLKEILGLKKEYEKLKEKIVLNGARENAAQIKLKNECESHLNTRKQLELTNQELIELKRRLLDQTTTTHHIEAVPINETDVSEQVTTQNAETTEIKEPVINNNESPLTISVPTTATSTASKLSPSSASNNQTNDLGNKIITRELYALKSQLKDMFEVRTTLRDKLQCLEQERKLQEVSLNKYKETLQSQKQMNKDLLNEILQLRELQETLTK
jgi:hypothetical protein